MTGDFIHDPEGIILFEEPTTVDVHSGGVNSTATIRVLPFSTRRDEEVFWAGPDTYHVPEDADYTIVEDLNTADEEGDLNTEEDNRISLSSLLAEG